MWEQPYIFHSTLKITGSCLFCIAIIQGAVLHNITQPEIAGASFHAIDHSMSTTMYGLNVYQKHATRLIFQIFSSIFILL